MQTIIVKPSRQRVDPRRPQSHPGYEKALAAGRRNMKNMEQKFESEGDKRDYMRKVAANPNNVPGLPPFYPPDVPKLFMSAETWPELTEEKWRAMLQERIRQFVLRDVELYCTSCHAVTVHSLSPKTSFCKKCGNYKPYHN